MKTARINLRVTPEQRQAIEQAARRAGMSLTDWVASRIIPEAFLRRAAEESEKHQRRKVKP